MRLARRPAPFQDVPVALNDYRTVRELVCKFGNLVSKLVGIVEGLVEFVGNQQSKIGVLRSQLFVPEGVDRSPGPHRPGFRQQHGRSGLHKMS